VILKVAHSQRESKLFWYVDNVFKGRTKTFTNTYSGGNDRISLHIVDEFGEIRGRLRL
jgi:penicillin-binding protein 1C